MMSDMFSVFDYFLGSGSFIDCILPWHGGLLLLFYLCCFSVYFYDFSQLEIFLFFLVDSLLEGMPEMSKIWAGTPHLMMSLFFMLWNICEMGLLPYSFSLGAHVVISGALSIPFWYMTFVMNFNSNWRLAWVKGIYEGNSFPVSMVVIGSECVSILMRPVTLAARLSLNIVVGNIAMKIISSLILGLFFPFSYGIFILSGSVLSGALYFMFMLFLGLVEFCMMTLQSMVFYALLVSYLSEVVVKPE
uniref:ATP synthase subunit a n=1 Tax=Paphia amabilis TaxID=676961 RepID=H6BHS6_9BIVA|nr:ATP synthase F0 subunit 6 [Paphia amabilis]AEH99617.1 ATP synthase F0 subunit 6 [Paphia amabilis]